MTGLDGHRTVADLLGAWALNACSPDESAQVLAHLGRCAECAREAGTLRRAAEGLIVAPLLEAAHRRRRPAPPAPPYAAGYAAQVAALDLTLGDLSAEQWSRTAAYDELTVHDLLAHLLAVDGLLAAGLGLPVHPPLDPGVSAGAHTATVVARERQWPPEATRRSWNDQATAICGLLLRQRALIETRVSLGGRPLPVPDALVARAYETWIHRDDIAAATGHPSVAPLPEHLHPMADLAARTLPAVLARRGTGPAGGTLRLHLSGAGGGVWTIPFRPSGPLTTPPLSSLTLGIVDFCLLVADRRRPGDVDTEISGDIVLATEILAAAPDLAPVP